MQEHDFSLSLEINGVPADVPEEIELDENAPLEYPDVLDYDTRDKYVAAVKKVIPYLDADRLEAAATYYDRERGLKQLDEDLLQEVQKHYLLEEQIKESYTVAREQNGFDSQEMEAVVQLCKEDLSLADKVIEYYARRNQILSTHVYFREYNPDYPTYKRLAIIYEKQKKYDAAIEVCKAAIEKSFPDDGSEGGMAGRIARLQKKIRT